MLSSEIAKKVLAVGPEYMPPKGGIAQIIYNYRQDVFPEGSFRYISNSCEGARIKKSFRLVSSLLSFFFKLLFCQEIKVVHIHTASRFSFKRSSWFIKVAKLFCKKIILHIHGGAFKDYYSAEKDFIDCTLNQCDQIVVLSKAWENWFRKTVGVKNVMVIPNVIPLPESCGRSNDDGLFHLLFLGYLAEGKGIFDLARAIDTHREQLKGRFIFHVAGNGRVDEFKKCVDELDLHDLIHYEGWVDNDAKHKLLCLCDALALPSYFEGLPISLLEAMSYHRPVLTTPVGGIPSIVDDGVNGFMVEPGDGEAMIEKIIYMMEHKEDCIAMGDSAFTKVQDFMPESVSTILEALYLNLIKKQSYGT